MDANRRTEKASLSVQNRVQLFESSKASENQDTNASEKVLHPFNLSHRQHLAPSRYSEGTSALSLQGEDSSIEKRDDVNDTLQASSHKREHFVSTDESGQPNAFPVNLGDKSTSSVESRVSSSFDGRTSAGQLGWPSNHLEEKSSISKGAQNEQLLTSSVPRKSKARRLQTMRSRSPSLFLHNKELKRNLDAASVVLEEEKASSVGSRSSKSSRSTRSSLSSEELGSVARRAMTLSKVRTTSRSSRLEKSSIQKLIRADTSKGPRGHTVETPIHIQSDRETKGADSHERSQRLDDSPLHQIKTEHSTKRGEASGVEFSTGERGDTEESPIGRSSPSLSKRLANRLECSPLHKMMREKRTRKAEAVVSETLPGKKEVTHSNSLPGDTRLQPRVNRLSRAERFASLSKIAKGKSPEAAACDSSVAESTASTDAGRISSHPVFGYPAKTNLSHSKSTEREKAPSHVSESSSVDQRKALLAAGIKLKKSHQQNHVQPNNTSSKIHAETPPLQPNPAKLRDLDLTHKVEKDSQEMKGTTRHSVKGDSVPQSPGNSQSSMSAERRAQLLKVSVKQMKQKRKLRKKLGGDEFPAKHDSQRASVPQSERRSDPVTTPSRLSQMKLSKSPSDSLDMVAQTSTDKHSSTTSQTTKPTDSSTPKKGYHSFDQDKRIIHSPNQKEGAEHGARSWKPKKSADHKRDSLESFGNSSTKFPIPNQNDHINDGSRPQSASQAQHESESSSENTSLSGSSVPDALQWWQKNYGENAILREALEKGNRQTPTDAGKKDDSAELDNEAVDRDDVFFGIEEEMSVKKASRKMAYFSDPGTSDDDSGIPLPLPHRNRRRMKELPSKSSSPLIPPPPPPPPPPSVQKASCSPSRKQNKNEQTGLLVCPPNSGMSATSDLTSSIFAVKARGTKYARSSPVETIEEEPESAGDDHLLRDTDDEKGDRHIEDSYEEDSVVESIVNSQDSLADNETSVFMNIGRAIVDSVCSLPVQVLTGKVAINCKQNARKFSFHSILHFS